MWERQYLAFFNNSLHHVWVDNDFQIRIREYATKKVRYPNRPNLSWFQ